MARIEAGMFDMGGVVTSGNWYRPTVREIAWNRDLSIEQVQKAWKEITPALATGKISEEEHWKRYPKGPNAKPLPKESLFLREFRRRFKPYAGTMDLLRRIKENGLSLAVISNTLEVHVRFLDEKGILDPFDVKVLSNEVGVEKPDPRVWEIALERLGVEPKQAFYVDDREDLLHTPAKMGIEIVWYRKQTQLRRDLKSLGVL